MKYPGQYAAWNRLTVSETQDESLVRALAQEQATKWGVEYTILQAQSTGRYWYAPSANRIVGSTDVHSVVGAPVYPEANTGTSE